ncbi:MAG: RNA polymerase sigma factor [Acidimicrobiia bacterium]|nr:RNA polymerase sigma factor [Acidimicrobiia bacterium]
MANPGEPPVGRTLWRGAGNRWLMDVRSDAELIEASWLEPRRFEDVFSRHYELIRAFLARRIGADVADDLAATTFLIAFESRGKYQTDRPDARPWLYGIASNVLRRHYRTEQRRLRAMARLGPEPAAWLDDEAATARVDSERMAPHIAAALLGLSKRTRDVVVLIAWEGLSYDETAEALGIRAGTVRSRLFQARRRLRDSLEPFGQYLGENPPRAPGVPTERRAET